MAFVIGEARGRPPRPHERAGRRPGFVASGGMLLLADAGWVVGPLTGCSVPMVLHVVVSLAIFGVSARVTAA